jgi:ubiquinone/menaquinone biosynthesis C-methylase UbiE
MPNTYFRVMSGLMAIRDAISPRRPVLEEAGVRPGQVLLDYGCGPGSYTLVAAEMVGPSGHVYAVDIHPMAIERIEARAKKRDLQNITTIMTDRDTGLAEGSVDMALLYDIIQLLSEPEGIVREVHRVLQSQGVLSVSGHSIPEVERRFTAMNDGRFKLSRRGSRSLSFVKS